MLLRYSLPLVSKGCPLRSAVHEVLLGRHHAIASETVRGVMVIVILLRFTESLRGQATIVMKSNGATVAFDQQLAKGVAWVRCGRLVVTVGIIHTDSAARELHHRESPCLHQR